MLRQNEPLPANVDRLGKQPGNVLEQAGIPGAVERLSIDLDVLLTVARTCLQVPFWKCRMIGAAWRTRSRTIAAGPTVGE